MKAWIGIATVMALTVCGTKRVLGTGAEAGGGCVEASSGCCRA